MHALLLYPMVIREWSAGRQRDANFAEEPLVERSTALRVGDTLIGQMSVTIFWLICEYGGNVRVPLSPDPIQGLQYVTFCRMKKRNGNSFPCVTTNKTPPPFFCQSSRLLLLRMEICSFPLSTIHFDDCCASSSLCFATLPPCVPTLIVYRRANHKDSCR